MRGSVDSPKKQAKQMTHPQPPSGGPGISSNSTRIWLPSLVWLPLAPSGKFRAAVAILAFRFKDAGRMCAPDDPIELKLFRIR